MGGEVQARAVVEFAKANGFPKAELIYWDEKAIQGIDDQSGLSRERAMENYEPGEGAYTFNLGIDFAESVKLEWVNGQIIEIGLAIDSIGGACPCQAQGTMNGRPFYFRARHGRWTLNVAEVGGDQINGDMRELLIEENGIDEWGGYMPKEEARKIIERVYAENQAKL